MANIMSLKSLRNKTSRNGFDLSFKKNFTAKAGELLPVMVKEVLPGDSFKINLKSFTRTQPINTAAFARIREYYDFFFVPYDSLWNKANTVFTQMYDNPQHSVSMNPTDNFVLSGTMPSITASGLAKYLVNVNDSGEDLNYFGYNRALCSAKLMEYLGYGNFYRYAKGDQFTWDEHPLLNNLNFNIFGFLAYQKIYSDYYRDSQWERIAPSTFNVDFMDGSGNNSIEPYLDGDSSSDIITNYNLFDLRYCNWQKDLFHGLVPHQQYGSASTVDVSLPNSLSFGNLHQKPTSTFEVGMNLASTSVHLNNPSSENALSFSILALRQAEFLQKWKEITQSGNKDYKDQIEKHWGVSAGDALSEMCTYLGGIASSLDINEVVNSNITGDNSADIAGKGTGVSNGYINFNAGAKYGVIMCIYHCLPMLDYTADLLESAFLKVNAADYAIPEFDRVGMEAVPFAKMINPLKNEGGLNFTPFASMIMGYAPRYIDYKTSVDSSIGGFRDTLKNWVISYSNTSICNQLSTLKGPALPGPEPSVGIMNYSFFKVNPNCLNPLFAVAVDSDISTDNFLCSSFFDVKVVRNLDADGLPY